MLKPQSTCSPFLSLLQLLWGDDCFRCQSRSLDLDVEQQDRIEIRGVFVPFSLFFLQLCIPHGTPVCVNVTKGTESMAACFVNSWRFSDTSVTIDLQCHT